MHAWLPERVRQRKTPHHASRAPEPLIKPSWKGQLSALSRYRKGLCRCGPTASPPMQHHTSIANVEGSNNTTCMHLPNHALPSSGPERRVLHQYRLTGHSPCFSNSLSCSLGPSFTCSMPQSTLMQELVAAIRHMRWSLRLQSSNGPQLRHGRA
jgi:hypothetical protein